MEKSFSCKCGRKIVFRKLRGKLVHEIVEPEGIEEEEDEEEDEEFFNYLDEQSE